nr:hypothetical protein JVH1_0431 [Rhodococcus sp. JVH1]
MPMGITFQSIYPSTAPLLPSTEWGSGWYPGATSLPHP